METTEKKSSARQRSIVIAVKYHYTSAGRRPQLRTDIARSVLNAVVRRLERHGTITVDSIDIKES